MVTLPKGFYLCHTFDLGSRLAPLRDWITRDSLPLPPAVLRYKVCRFDNMHFLINQFGFAVVFQYIPDANSYTDALRTYEKKFDLMYSEAVDYLSKTFGKGLTGESSFITAIGSEKLCVEWRITHVPMNDYSLPILVEALFIDELCRVMERRSSIFVEHCSLAEERTLVETAEALFPLHEPSAFLVSRDEINHMEAFYKNWNLQRRIHSIRSRFAESVSNTALYRGHLERDRQGALNTLLAAIAALSLAQVSGPLSEVMSTLGIQIQTSRLNQLFVVFAIVLLLWGFYRNILHPKLSMISDQIMRKNQLYKLQKTLDKAPEDK